MDLIDRVLDLLEADPGFPSFHLDGQTIVLEDYLEVRPEQTKRLSRLIAEGRLLVGPWYVMPDQFLVSGEALVRNLALGHRLAARFGRPMPVGYLPDPFGHVAQMPQILSQFGLDSAVLWRGFGGPRAEYWWEAPDGSRVLMLHLPREGYGNALRLPLLPAEQARDQGAALIAREAARSACGQVLLMVGVDHVEPHAGLTGLPALLRGRDGLRVRHSTLPAYVEAVRGAVGAAGNGLETVQGELRAGQDHAFLLPGVLSTRSYLKQANGRVQSLLERWAEPAALFAWLAGEDHPTGVLAYAWKTLLQNHPHDSICGCSVDPVHEENLTRFARAGQTAEAVMERALAALARRVEAPAAGSVRCLVVNTAPEAYRGVVEGVVELAVESAEPGRVVDPDLLEAPVVFTPQAARPAAMLDAEGGGVPFQLLREEDGVSYRLSRFEPPWPLRVRRLRLAWWVPEVPGCGYSAFDLRLSPGDGSAPAATDSPPPVRAGDRWLENELLRVEVNGDGTLEVRDKRTGTLFRRVGELEDTGDVGDEYTHCPPDRDRRVGSEAARLVEVRLVDAGPLRGTLRVDLELPVPEEATADRQARSAQGVTLPVLHLVSLEAGSPRLSWTTRLDNRARDHRLRVLFPTGARAVEGVRADSAFAVVSRPARPADPPANALEPPPATAPLQSFVDAGDEGIGVTVFSEGLMEYEVVPGSEARVALTLLRCVGDLSRDDLATRSRAHAGPALKTPGAQCPGPHEFRFAMQPRGQPPVGAALYADARSFLAGLRVVSATGPYGSLPPRLSFLRIEPEGAAVLSAAKKADERDSMVVRLFNPGDRPVRVALRTSVPLAGAYALNLREERRQELRWEDGAVSVTLDGGRIETVEVIPERRIIETPRNGRGATRAV